VLVSTFYIKLLLFTAVLHFSIVYLDEQ
jgi:hypothetical protein